MYQMVEAVVKNGVIQPLEAFEYEENTRLLLMVLPQPPELINDDSRRKKLADCFKQLAQSAAFSEIKDPVAWQKEVREDKPLFGRD
jgi:hypothetical protein